MTVNEFIKELQSIPESRKELPIKIECPNGMMVSPNTKLEIENVLQKNQKVKAIIVTWKD